VLANEPGATASCPLASKLHTLECYDLVSD
jgi:hypothetical protein